MTYYTDADIEMAELAEMGRDIANGVCPRCTEPLDPRLPKWDGIWHERYTRENALGRDGLPRPNGTYAEGYHDDCILDEW